MGTQTSPIIFLFILAFTLGLRHGIDWDHIAAITDIVSSTGNRRKAIYFGALYIFGHATVIILLGILSVIVGITLPRWIDSVMERVVGVTLILLGIWLLTSIFLHGKNFRMKSSRIFLIEQSIRLYRIIHDRIPHTHHRDKEVVPGQINEKSAVAIGMIHGIGAETPTQMLLFVTAAGVGRGIVGILLVSVFVCGLVISNFSISLLSYAGFAHMQKNSAIRLGIGIITALFSLIVGIFFLLKRGNLLPALLGG